MAIYKAGTLSVTANSTTVTGQGTAFTITGVAGGLLVLGGVSALIASVESETSLTLSQPWAGDTQAGAEYSISLVAAEAASTVAASARIAELVASIGDQINLVDPSDFASGDVDGNAQNALQLGGRPAVEFVGAIDHAALTSNPHSVTKDQVGLGSVDNTADADKPVSTAVQSALDDAGSATQNALDEITSSLDGKASAEHNHTADDIEGFNGAVQSILGTSLEAGENIDIQYDEETGLATITGEAGGGGDLVNPTVFGDYPSENLGRWDRIAHWNFTPTPFNRLSVVALVHCRFVSTVYNVSISATSGADGVVNGVDITISSNASSFEDGDRFLVVRDEGSNSIGLYYSRTELPFMARFLNILSSHNGFNNEITLDKTIVEGQGTQAPSGNQSILSTGPSSTISANPFVVFDGTNGNIIHSNKIQSLTRMDQGRYTVDFVDGTWNSANYMGVGSARKNDSNHDGNIGVQVGGASGVTQTQSRTFMVVGFKSSAIRQDSPLVGVTFFGDLSETADNTQAVATVINNTGGATIDPAIPTHLNATNNPHSVTAEQVGLGNVDNTSDADKPISTATQAALDDAASNTETALNDAATATQTALDGKAPVDHTHSIDDIEGLDGLGGGDTTGVLFNPSRGENSTLGLLTHESGRETGVGTMSTSWMMVYGFPLGGELTISKLTIFVSTAGSDEIGIALYGSGGDDAPAELLHNFGTIDCSTTGAKTLTLDEPVVIPAGLYWVATSSLSASAVVRGGPYPKDLGQASIVGTLFRSAVPFRVNRSTHGISFWNPPSSLSDLDTRPGGLDPFPLHCVAVMFQ